MGWIGDVHEMVYTLKALGAEQDEQGNVKLYGEPPCFGLDGEEVVVGPACSVLIDGQARPVAALLATTSYGFCCNVF